MIWVQTTFEPGAASSGKSALRRAVGVDSIEFQANYFLDRRAKVDLVDDS